ncbi:hypothetical protein EVAR_20933_1 [Eumeta japonica]|uniref:Nucleic-acid-binding protein from transposon X-element n=1 Tax=Eumeta variegata TaxID=151549 RepID=A0A4C1UW71_EUMVA|nr:hypothetical protein EVAR_20933_1 [Eumeta japonica]
MQQRCRHQCHDPPSPPQHMQLPFGEGNTANTKWQNNRSQEVPRRAKGYPPVVVEHLPNWTRHFSELKKHPPNARPFKSGVSFLPAIAEEFIITQRYLQSMSSKDPAITWYCYTPTNERPTNVGVRGLPGDTNLQEILVALQQLDFPATYARRIPPRRDSSGCLFFVQLKHLNEEELERLYAVKEILNMPGVTLEAWWDPHEMPGFSPGGTRKRTESPAPPPSGERPEASRGQKGTPRPAASPPETQHHYEDSTMMEGRPTPPRLTEKPKPIQNPSPGTRGDHETGTTARVHHISRAATDLAPQGSAQQMQPKPKKGKRSIKRRKMLQQQQQRQQQSIEPRAAGHLPEGRVRRADQLRTVPPSQITQPQLQPQPHDSHHFCNSGGWPGDHNPPPPYQNWPRRPGPDTEHSGEPGIRGDVLNLRILYWNLGGIMGKTRELRDFAQLEDAHIILLGETKLRP